MRPAITIDAGRAEAAAAALAIALGGRPLVSAERFTTAYRTSYTGPCPIEAIRPALVVGCYRPWHPALPTAVVAAEEATRARSPRLRHTWQDQALASACQALSEMAMPPVVTGWYATTVLRDLAGSGGTVAAIDGALRDRLENKADFGQFIQAAGVPTDVQISSVRISGKLPALAELRRQVGTSRVVVQAGVTSGGGGTVIVDTDQDLAAAALMLSPYRVAAFIEGWSSNVTVLSIPDGNGGVRVYVDQPSHKAIAVGELGIGPAKSAGNDWSLPWPAPSAAVLAEAAVRIGEWAWVTHRMAGLFGLDAILTLDGQVKINEINWRNQGTTEASAVNQQLRGQPPFLIAHLVTMLGAHPCWLPDPDTFNHETLNRATEPGPGPFYVKLRHAGPAPARISPDFPGSGVYRLDQAGRLQRRRDGGHPADADADLGEILIANAPGPDITCHPGAELATFEGITSGPGRPFDGPGTASAHVLQCTAAFRSLFTPVSVAEEAGP